MSKYGHLLSGSDVRGVAVAGYMDQPVNLTGEIAGRIAGAFALWMGGSPRIAVGADSRLSSPQLARAVCDALAAAGCHVLDVGMASTPAMFMTTLESTLNCDGAVMITASHLPYNRNGLKFFTRRGGLEHSEVEEILTLAEGELPVGEGRVEPVEFMGCYAGLLRERIVSATGKSRPFEGMRIVVDAGNGVGGFFARDVLVPLGADITGSQFLEPDGRFPNHIPNPEDKEAMASIRGAVLESGARLGIIFDTDCDRAAVVDGDGAEINRNRLVAMMSAIVLEKHPGATVVTDSVTCAGLREFIESRGGKHYRYRRGYRNVIDEAVRLSREGTFAPLAMETSGHCALSENHYLDDGAYLVVLVLIELARLEAQGKGLSHLIEGLREPVEAAEVRIRITAEDFARRGREVLDKVLRHSTGTPGWTLADDNREGVRVSFGPEDGDGWFLLRMSLHDPVLPLNMESDRPGGVRKIAAALYPLLAGEPELDLDQLKATL